MGFFSSLKDRFFGKAPAGKTRSSAWPKARAEFLKDHAACEVCGSTKKLEVHHCRPFHLHPELELDPHNFVTLCESGEGGVNCHLHFGHLGSFKAFNVAVKEDVVTWNAKIKNRPLSDESQELALRRPRVVWNKSQTLADDEPVKPKRKRAGAKTRSRPLEVLAQKDGNIKVATAKVRKKKTA